MNHKILCVDLDATLLCDDKSISQKNRDAIHKMLEAGHYIALATGRPVETAREVARKEQIGKAEYERKRTENLLKENAYRYFQVFGQVAGKEVGSSTRL